MKYFLASDVFISQLGYFDHRTKKFVAYPPYSLPLSIIVKDKNGYYKDYKASMNLSLYPALKDCPEAEIMWENLFPIWPYLNEEERKEGKVSYAKLTYIYYEVNGLGTKEEKNEENVLKFKPRYKGCRS